MTAIMQSSVLLPYYTKKKLQQYDMFVVKTDNSAEERKTSVFEDCSCLVLSRTF